MFPLSPAKYGGGIRPDRLAASEKKGNNRTELSPSFLLAVLHSFDEGASAVAATPTRRTDQDEDM